MEVSLVMTHIGRPPTLSRCLSFLAEQTRPIDEIVVVDGTRERLNENDGMNAGIQRSSGDIVMTTNVDCYVPEDWVERHLEWHRRGFDLVSGLRLNINPISSSWNALHQGKPQYVQGPGVGWSLSNGSFRRSAFDKTGPISTRSGRVWDTAFALMAVKTGCTMVIDPSIVVRHDHELKGAVDSFLKAKRVFSWNKEAMDDVGRYGVDPSLSSTLKEMFLVGGVQAWKAYDECRQLPLPRFLNARVMFRAGQLWGLMS